jgi:SAM-dependent methyltransferase
MTDVTELGPAAAREWVTRWDQQQELYHSDREDRFTALIDAAQAGAGRPDPLILDLGCGPGSLAVRLLARLPRATVVAVDADPVTLSIGRAAYADVPGLRFLDLDLRSSGWPAGLGLDLGQRLVDAVVSTTALHWLTAAELAEFYQVLASLLRPGGLYLDGDHLRLDASDSPVLAGLERVLEEREKQRRSPAGSAGRETWEQWWQAVSADPSLAAEIAERDRRSVHHHGPEGTQLAVHAAALRAAGFAEVGTLWQRGGKPHPGRRALAVNRKILQLPGELKQGLLPEGVMPEGVMRGPVVPGFHGKPRIRPAAARW